MTTYTDVFGTDTVPPAGAAYASLSFAVDTTLVWPYNSTGGTWLSKITDINPTAAGLSLTLPDATEVSTGEDFLLRNIGSETVTIKDDGGNTVATVVSGAAKYFYLTTNVTADGTWAVIAYGVGSSSTDAATLVGYGLKAIGSTLNAAHPVFATAAGMTITDIYRAQLVNYSGGVGTIALDTVADIGDDFYIMLRNSGTGTLTIDPHGSETIDGQLTITMQPGESAMIVASSTAWFTVGFGRSIQYNFTQLVKDVSAYGGSSVTLTAAEASNKLLRFIGNPAASVTVYVPNVVAVYYVYSDITTANDIVIATLTGSGASVAQGQRVITICDATDIVSAQSAATSSSTSFIDGSVTTPSIKWTTQTNTGFYKYGSTGIGLAVNGVLAAFADYSGGVGKLYNASSQEYATIAYVDTEKQVGIPAGSVTLFYSNTAPTGWTKSTTAALDNTALRIVSDGSQSGGNGGVTGGTTTFNACFGSSKSTGSYTLTTADIPGHTHTFSGTTGNDSPDHTHNVPYPGQYGLFTAGGTVGVQPGGASATSGASARHTHTFSGTTASTGSDGGHAHAIDFDVRYASFIVASKDAY
jgi:hypothetical protein